MKKVKQPIPLKKQSMMLKTIENKGDFMKEICEKGFTSLGDRVIKFKINIPPSVNEYYTSVKINGKLRRIVSYKGKKYREYIYNLVAHNLKHEDVFTGKHDRIEVLIHMYPLIDNRDLDNIDKCLLDSLKNAGVFYDDKCVVHLNAWKHKPDKNNGFITVDVREELDDYY